MREQEDFFNEYYESLGHYKWVGVKDLSELFLQTLSKGLLFEFLWLGGVHLKF